VAAIFWSANGWSLIFVRPRRPVLGRSAEDSEGRAHVVLRGEDALVTLAVVDGGLREIRRQATCRAPRGIAWDAVAERVHVACVDGHLDSFDPETGERTRRLLLGTDLRSVVPLPDGRLAVTRFRRAKVLVVDPEGALLSEAEVAPNGAAAWDAALIPGEETGAAPASVAIVHQVQTEATVRTSGGGYGGSRSSTAVHAVSTPTLTVWNIDAGERVSSTESTVVLPVDIEVSADAFAMVDGSVGESDTGRTILVFGAIGVAEGPVLGPAAPLWTTTAATDAVALTRAGPIVWSATAGALRFPTGPTVHVTPARKTDTGFDLFHLATPTGITCASCHPGGRDDGHVWTFLGSDRTASPAPRRTQPLVGGIMGTAPFHWNGEHRDLEPLLHDVMAGRMGAGDPTAEQRAVLGDWLDALPAPPPPAGLDAAAVARGRALFHDADAGCATCHGDDGGPSRTIATGTSAPAGISNRRCSSVSAPAPPTSTTAAPRPSKTASTPTAAARGTATSTTSPPQSSPTSSPTSSLYSLVSPAGDRSALPGWVCAARRRGSDSGARRASSRCHTS